MVLEKPISTIDIPTLVGSDASSLMFSKTSPTVMLISPMTAPNNTEDNTSTYVQLPPDLISASSGSCGADHHQDDDVSELSSVDAQQEDDDDDSPRSIFSGYWKKSGVPPIPLERQPLPLPTKSLPDDWKLNDASSNDDDDMNSFALYERTLQEQECTNKDKKALFPNHSVPSLRRNLAFLSLSRNASSTSQLDPRIKTPKPLTSCLHDKSTATNHEHHVKFDTKVSVLEYNQNAYRDSTDAQDGWSKYFH